jgi:hypothetical protein
MAAVQPGALAPGPDVTNKQPAPRKIPEQRRPQTIQAAKARNVDVPISKQ